MHFEVVMTIKSMLCVMMFVAGMYVSMISTGNKS